MSRYICIIKIYLKLKFSVGIKFIQLRKSSGELVPESGIFVCIKTEYETHAQPPSLEQDITCSASDNVSGNDMVVTAEQNHDSKSIDSTSAPETQFNIQSQDEGSDREVQTIEVPVDVYLNI